MTIKGASILLIIGRKNTTHTIAIKMDLAKIIKIVKIGKKRGTRNSI